MAAKTSAPLAFRFRPTDQEAFIILDMLVKKKQLPSFYPVVERNLFGDKPPWSVLKDDDPWEFSTNKKTLFVFTKLVVLGKNRSVRSSACGTWDGKAANNKINNSAGVVIGHKKYYTFKPKNNCLETTNSNGKWMIHEYSFPNNKSSYVLCKITVDGLMSATTTTRGGVVDDGLCGKRKWSSTSLDDDDDGGSRKVCKENGLENSVFPTNYDCSFRTMQRPEILIGGTHDDIVKESSWCAGSSSNSTVIDQLHEKTEETGPISVTTELGEIGTANDDFNPWTCIDFDDDLIFQIPWDMDEWEILSFSGGMQELLVDDNYRLEDFLFETSKDCVVSAEPLRSFPTVQIQQVKEMSAGGTRDYVPRSNLDEAESWLLLH